MTADLSARVAEALTAAEQAMTLVERLRHGIDQPNITGLLSEAADRIEKLEQAVPDVEAADRDCARLRAELAEVREDLDHQYTANRHLVHEIIPLRAELETTKQALAQAREERK